jgi:hypothetical protein
MRDELIPTTIRDLSGQSRVAFSATPLNLIQALSQLERGESSVSREHTDQGQRRRALAFIAENRPTCLRKMTAELTLSERS